jgi:hypothetical protein
MYQTIRFLDNVPSVIVDPGKVFEAEIKAYPILLRELPVELNLQVLPPGIRGKTLLEFLHRSQLFLEQGKDIEVWRNNYQAIKAKWLQDVTDIKAHAIANAYLQCDSKGDFVNLQETRELSLMALDLRHAGPSDISSLIARRSEHRGDFLTAIRLTSLCFWYAYIDIDNTNKLKQNPSDIGDFYHLSLVPYCKVFTCDSSMFRLIQRISLQVKQVNCDLMDKKRLDQHISKFTLDH